MQTFKHTISIARPREEVFDYFTNFAAASEWRLYVRSMIPQGDGAVKTGSKINVVMDVAGGEYAFVMTVLACERPSLWRHQTNEPDFDGYIEYRFEPEQNGTRITFTGDAKPRSLYGWLGLPFMWLSRRRSYREQLPQLKRVLESA
jgi:uncharacterized protein YndB with AHSA1/START domain